MTYYDRIRNRNDRNLYESPEEKEERFRRLLENQEISERKELYKFECRKEEGEAQNDKLQNRRRNRK